MTNPFNGPYRKSAIILSLYAFLLSFALVGIRFESPILNYIIVAILLTSPLYLLYILFFCFKPNATAEKVSKAVALAVVGIGAFFCTLFLLFHLLAITFLISDGNVDMSKVEIDRVTLNDHTSVVAYQTNGGATTDFGTTIYKERWIFSGLKIVNRIDGAYHTNDIVLELVEGRIIVKDMTFTGPTYEQEYYEEGGSLRDGAMLEI